MQSALAKERREVKQCQREAEMDSIPMGLNKHWVDPLPDGKSVWKHTVILNTVRSEPLHQTSSSVAAAALSVCRAGDGYLVSFSILTGRIEWPAVVCRVLHGPGLQGRLCGCKGSSQGPRLGLDHQSSEGVEVKYHVSSSQLKTLPSYTVDGRQIAANMRGIGMMPDGVPEWKKHAFGGNQASYGKKTVLSILEQRESLPIFKLKEQLIQVCNSNFPIGRNKVVVNIALFLMLPYFIVTSTVSMIHFI